MTDVILAVALTGYVVFIAVALSTIFVWVQQEFIRLFFAIAYPLHLLPTNTRSV
jgi:hypothetical protein